MSKVSLPPLPGFGIVKGTGRYFYPFSKSKMGEFAAEWHADFLNDFEKGWRKSKLNLLINRKARYLARKELAYLQGGATARERAKIIASYRRAALFQLNQLSPIFFRRDVVDQVLWLMMNQPRYYMKLDIKNAFGSVFPGCHPRWPEKHFVVRTGDDLFDLKEYDWSGWPFYHRDNMGLIQGAPASPLLFDLYCQRSGFDNMLRQLARENGAKVVRSADDITLVRSSPFGRQLFNSTRRRMAGFGFELNEAKSGCFDTKKGAVKFLGMSIRNNKVRPIPGFYESMAEHGVTDGRLEWEARVLGINDDLRQYWRRLYCR